MNVDVIIPIYNAFEDLQKCLESIYQYTDLCRHRLILINDKSTDNRIRPFLDAQKGEHIIIINNETNRGFSNNINLGMAQSNKNDVLLLNSDTVVTERWLDKMVDCAYSNVSIGTVTPLSNNATLCSVPDFCKENSLPEGMNVERVAQIVEECSMKKYPRITVAHGFCMYIKREVIQCIGNFDAETFGRGYGEENDFCNRAEQMGYTHVMCDNTYIFHSGTKSFMSKEKEAFIQEHEKILRSRYPQQMLANDLHCNMNPNHFVGENIGLYLNLYNGNKNILYLLQSDFREGADDNIGGTQLHVKQLTERLRKNMNVFVAARNRDFLQVTAYVKENEYTFCFYIGKLSLYPLHSDKRLISVYQNILTIFKIDLIHVHHTASTSLDIFYEAEKKGIPVFYTIHDFYFICPTIKMLECRKGICVEKESPDCKQCLNEWKGIAEGLNYLRLWRRRHAEVLQICKRIIAPSVSAQDIFLKYYPECAEKVCVIPHGIDKQKIAAINEEKLTSLKKAEWEIKQIDTKTCCISVLGIIRLTDIKPIQKIFLMLKDCSGKTFLIPSNQWKGLQTSDAEKNFYVVLPNYITDKGDVQILPIVLSEGQYFGVSKKSYTIKHVKKAEKNRKQCFRVAFIGGIDRDKGGEKIAQIIQQAEKDIEWYVFGGIGEEALAAINQKNLVKTGFYKQDDIASLLLYHKIDVVCLLSLVPETFSYTLSEALINHIPVIVTDAGALADRVNSCGCGVVVRVTHVVDDVLSCIERWKDRGTEYLEVLNRAKQYCHMNTAEMAEKYVQYYQEEFIGHNSVLCGNNQDAYEFIYKAYTTSPEQSGEMELLLRHKELEEYLQVIDSSISFRIVRKLTGIKLPFKKQLRSILQRIWK